MKHRLQSNNTFCFAIQKLLSYETIIILCPEREDTSFYRGFDPFLCQKLYPSDTVFFLCISDARMNEIGTKRFLDKSDFRLGIPLQ